jgi:sulfopyruvate decarboxylase TPP-binding subunit
MIKAEEFWEYLCNTLEYRFFAGVPCEGLEKLYNKMDAQKMHYIPAVSEAVAAKMASGVFITGIKSGILIDIASVKELDLEFNFSHNIPLLIVASGDSVNKLGCHSILLSEDFENCLSKVDNYMTSKQKSCVLIIGKGALR